jgi:hypothetical protein
VGEVSCYLSFQLNFTLDETSFLQAGHLGFAAAVFVREPT